MAEISESYNPNQAEVENPYVTLDQLKAWNSMNYHIETHGRQFSAVILGENHNHGISISEQGRMIELVKPKFVLHELLGGFIRRPVNKNAFEQQVGRIYNENDMDIVAVPFELMVLSYRLGFQLVGCDLTTEEMSLYDRKLAAQFPEKYGYDKQHDLLIDKSRGNRLVLDKAREHRTIREAHAINMISAYQNMSDRPIVVILSASQARNISKSDDLRTRGFGYAIVDQTRTGRRFWKR